MGKQGWQVGFRVYGSPKAAGRSARATLAICLLGAFLCVESLAAQTPAAPAASPASTLAFQPATDSFDYVKRDVMIPMRDGVKLHTVIVVPKGAKNAPILFTRTPYNA